MPGDFEVLIKRVFVESEVQSTSKGYDVSHWHSHEMHRILVNLENGPSQSVLSHGCPHPSESLAFRVHLCVAWQKPSLLLAALVVFL